MSYALFLDDDPDRIPSKLSWIELPRYSWIIARNYDEFVEIIAERGIPEVVSFDHDLGTEHYTEIIAACDKNSPSFGRIRYELFKEKTGYDCAKWLAELCVARNVPIPQYYIHTLNPIGGQNIFSVMESARKTLTEAKE